MDLELQPYSSMIVIQTETFLSFQKFFHRLSDPVIKIFLDDLDINYIMKHIVLI